VVYGEIDITNAPGSWRLNIVDIATGIVKPFSDENWANAFRIEWLRDGSGIVLIGTRAGDGMSASRDQVYFVSYPEGISRRITSDGNLYDANSLGITRDGAILAIPSNRSSQIWSMRSNGDMATAVQITRGLADGRGGLVTLPDGRIAYIARTSVDLTVWIANGDGSGAKQLSTGYQFLEELRADATGKYLIFSAPKDSLHHLFRIDINSGEVKQLTLGE